MARNTKNQQVIRVVKFLLGLRRPEAHRPLRAYGLTPRALAEAQDLLREATSPRLDRHPALGPPLLDALDAYENRWLRIARAALKHRYPEIYDWVFNNIAQTSGVDLVISVDAVVRRLRELESGESPFGEQGQEAMALLADRGFNSAVLQEGEELAQRVAEFKPPPSFDPEVEARKVAALWSWYLEWSEIARNVITDRRILRRLGFLNGNGANGNAANGNGARGDESDSTEPQATGSNAESGTHPVAEGSTEVAETGSSETGTDS